MVLYRDHIDIKFYETKTGKLFKTLQAQYSITGLEIFDNKALINFGELKKAFLYSLKQSYNKISNFNGKLEKVSAFTNNYVIAYFSNGNIYIYYKDFKIKKL